MKEFVEEYYIQPEKMTTSSVQSKTEDRKNSWWWFDEYSPQEEDTVQLEQQNHPSDTGEDNIIVIQE